MIGKQTVLLSKLFKYLSVLMNVNKKSQDETFSPTHWDCKEGAR